LLPYRSQRSVSRSASSEAIVIFVTEAIVLQTLVETKCQTAKCLCDAIERKGYPRKDVQLAIQRAIESGVVLCATDWSLSVAAQEGSGVEGLRSDDAPASIEDLDAALRRGREIGGMIVGSADLRGPAQPVAWRVKDFADGWILCHTLAEAQREAQGAGNLVQPLYAERLA
jgi:hypothetical protein